ncbi:hypothetical protein DIPPA_18178 [Diplonema papillatum]|nr:hypothetical protein DIPPA_18178 [Diplonema papillatum]
MSLMGQNLGDLWSAFQAGFLSAAAAKTAVAPLDRAKLLLQTQRCNYSITSGEVARYKGAVDCCVRVAKEQGVTALWRGNTVDVLRYAPTHGFNFFFKDYFSLSLPQAARLQNPVTAGFLNVATGSAAGVASLVLLHPFDVVRTKLATDVGVGYTRQYRSMLDCALKTVKLGGPLNGLYAGFCVSVPSIVVFRGIYFGGFQTANQWVPKNSPWTVHFLIAQLATSLASLAAYPFDTVRRRVMLQPGSREQLYASARDCARRMLADEGGRAFYSGALTNVFRHQGAALVLLFARNSHALS